MAPQISDLYSSKNVNESGEKFYVTTAINYTNGLPHIGHAYEALLADVIARYHRAYGRNVFFLTGTDEHGQKIATHAEAKGMKPIELCDMYVEKFRELNEALHISNDEYIRTTDHYHEESCRALWKRCSDNGDIYLGEYTGWYDVREETFVTDSDAQKMNFKDAYGTDLKKVSEPCYFFRLSKYRERLLQYYEENPEAIMPTIRRQEVLAMLASYPELPDLCISRTAFDWGVSLPDGFQEKHVMYVWFDALTNYISASHLVLPEEQQDPKRTALWPADCHVVGKDITRFHCIYWPAMLWSAGLAPPKCVAGHGFVQDGEGKKMSKSVGNVVDPNDLLKSYPSDSIRYYCVNEANFGPDLKCSESNLVEAHNNNLADTVGNLMQRAVKLPELYTNGLVPAKPAGASLPLPFDLAALKASVEEYMKSYQTKPALMEVIAACSAVNNWITTTAPFKMKVQSATHTSSSPHPPPNTGSRPAGHEDSVRASGPRGRVRRGALPGGVPARDVHAHLQQAAARRVDPGAFRRLQQPGGGPRDQERHVGRGCRRALLEDQDGGGEEGRGAQGGTEGQEARQGEDAPSQGRVPEAGEVAVAEARVRRGRLAAGDQGGPGRPVLPAGVQRQGVPRGVGCADPRRQGHLRRGGVHGGRGMRCAVCLFFW